MAVAAAITDCDPAAAAWLKIRDDAGADWTYRQADPVEPPAPAHVVYAAAGTGALPLALARRDDGEVILRQDGPGLPMTLVARLPLHLTGGPGGGGGRQCLFLYQRD